MGFNTVALAHAQTQLYGSGREHTHWRGVVAWDDASKPAPIKQLTTDRQNSSSVSQHIETTREKSLRVCRLVSALVDRSKRRGGVGRLLHTAKDKPHTLGGERGGGGGWSGGVEGMEWCVCFIRGRTLRLIPRRFFSFSEI